MEKYHEFAPFVRKDQICSIDKVCWNMETRELESVAFELIMERGAEDHYTYSLVIESD